jgi:hypothetical protein
MEKRLQALKQQAQSPDKETASAAQTAILDVLFAVSDRGAGKYKYVLKSEPYRLSVPSSKASSLPVAYCQLASHWLTQHGLLKSVQQLNSIVNSMATDVQEPLISRVDLYVDFVPGFDINDRLGRSFSSRARQTQMYQDSGKVTGLGFGKGGAIQARLYNKSVEIKKSRKDYLLPIWKEKGWNGQSDVWRLEFELKREFLTSAGISNLDDLALGAQGLWNYCTREWLRLCIPCQEDTNKSRWPTDPAWDAVSDLPWQAPDEPLDRKIKNPSLPNDSRLFTNPLGGITSFMAREGITNVEEGLIEYIEKARQFHDIQGRSKGRNFHSYIKEKVQEKARLYGTINNTLGTKQHLQKVGEIANAYLRGRDGE